MTRYLSLLLALSLAPLAHGLPMLQLGIGGGSYDLATETIVTDADAFTLYAYGKASGGKSVDVNEFHYISVAITPQIGPDPVDFGSFIFGGTSYDINNPDVVWGVPPLEENLDKDKHDLPTHGIYPTFFLEIEFLFDANQTTGFVNTQYSPEYVPTDNGDMLFYQGFDFDTSGMIDGFHLHFDLYNTKAKNGDIDVDDFAPFSHDAGTIPQPAPVPEPNTTLLLFAAIAGLVFARRERLKPGKPR